MVWIDDGQHRLYGAKANGVTHLWIHLVEINTKEEAAERFLSLNDTLSVRPLDKFRIGVTAGRPEEVAINHIVLEQGLQIGTGAKDVQAVGALGKVYGSGPDVLIRTLNILDQAWGPEAMKAPLIEGMGHVCATYNGQLEDVDAISKLGRVKNGRIGIATAAEVIRSATQNSPAVCHAQAIVNVLNTGRRGGRRLSNFLQAVAVVDDDRAAETKFQLLTRKVNTIAGSKAQMVPHRSSAVVSA